jgi:hypothetical protein
MVRGGDSALRGGEASTTALLLASRVLLYFTMRRGAGAARRRGVPRPWACSRRRGHSTPPMALGPPARPVQNAAGAEERARQQNTFAQKCDACGRARAP